MHVEEKITFILEFVDFDEGLSILHCYPWTFDRALLVLKLFQVGMITREVDFSSYPFWIHFVGFPYD